MWHNVLPWLSLLWVWSKPLGVMTFWLCSSLVLLLLIPYDRVDHVSKMSGHVIAQDGEFQTQIEGESFNAVVGYILSCACFFYIGAWLPWDGFSMPELGITPWRLVVLCIGILFLRRIPAVLMLYKWIPEISNWKEALFCGHFGALTLCCFCPRWFYSGS